MCFMLVFHQYKYLEVYFYGVEGKVKKLLSKAKSCIEKGNLDKGIAQ